MRKVTKKNIKKEYNIADIPPINLKPLMPLELSKVKSINDLVTQMTHTAFGARALGEATDVLYQMATDKDCFVVLTLSGALTVAKMGLVICELIDNGIIGTVVTTGAIIVHNLVESAGMYHFQYKPNFQLNTGISEYIIDEKLHRAGYDRVYDTLELEKNLDDIEEIFKKVLDKVNRDTVLSSRFLTQKLGEYLAKNTKIRNILKSAYRKKVPIFIPAFTDSELGLDLALYNRRVKKKNRKTFRFDPFLDLENFAKIIKTKKRIGIFTVGGGVPRNWAQQVGPYFDILQKRIGSKIPHKRYTYGVRICPEPPWWGGLSGCTYSEGVSWGKFTPPSKGGRWAEVYADATIALPLIAKALLERIKKPL